MTPATILGQSIGRWLSVGHYIDNRNKQDCFMGERCLYITSDLTPTGQQVMFVTNPVVMVQLVVFDGDYVYVTTENGTWVWPDEEAQLR